MVEVEMKTFSKNSKPVEEKETTNDIQVRKVIQPTPSNNNTDEDEEGGNTGKSTGTGTTQTSSLDTLHYVGIALLSFAVVSEIIFNVRFTSLGEATDDKQETENESYFHTTFWVTTIFIGLGFGLLIKDNATGMNVVYALMFICIIIFLSISIARGKQNDAELTDEAKQKALRCNEEDTFFGQKLKNFFQMKFDARIALLVSVCTCFVVFISVVLFSKGSTKKDLLRMLMNMLIAALLFPWIGICYAFTDQAHSEVQRFPGNKKNINIPFVRMSMILASALMGLMFFKSVSQVFTV